MCWCFRKAQKNGTERFRSDVPTVKVYSRDYAICLESIEGEKVLAEVFGVSGQLVELVEFENSAQISVSEGLYLVRLTTSQGTSTVKVLVK